MEETTSSAAATDPSPPNLEEISDKSKISATKDNLDSLQASKDNNNDFEQFTGKRWWGAFLLAIVISIFSIIPPLFIMLDRWLFFKPIMDYSWR